MTSEQMFQENRSTKVKNASSEREEVESDGENS